MKVFIIILILILLIIISSVCVYFFFKKKIENFSQNIFGTKDIMEGFKKQELEYQETPKSVYGLDSVIIPKLLKDFPYTDVNILKKKAESALVQYFVILEKGKIERMTDASPKLLQNLETLINNKKANYKNFKIHRTVISSYDNKKGSCILTFQSAVEYVKQTGSTSKKTQGRYNIELIYIYDETNVKDAYGVSLKCKNCGAPIKTLGEKTCQYCGTGIVEYTSKIWTINDIYEK